MGFSILFSCFLVQEFNLSQQHKIFDARRPRCVLFAAGGAGGWWVEVVAEAAADECMSGEKMYFTSTEHQSTLSVAIRDVWGIAGCFDHMKWSKTTHILHSIRHCRRRRQLVFRWTDFLGFRCPLAADKWLLLQHPLALVLPRTVLREDTSAVSGHRNQQQENASNPHCEATRNHQLTKS